MADSLYAAIADLQANPPKISKRARGQVGTREYKYATLDAIWAALEPWRLAHGIIWICCPSRIDGAPILAYRLVQIETGNQVTGLYPLTDAHGQALGADITYARRYALCAVLGLLADDDTDGQPIEPRQRSKVRADPDHERLANSIERQQPGDRPAERARSPAQDDPWADEPPGQPEHERGSIIIPDQRTKIMRHLGSLKSADRAARLREITGDETIDSTNDLSAHQAGLVIAELETRR